MTADKLELIRQQSMEQYGFGPAAMKKVKVCTVCGNPSPSDQQFCTECGHRLPDKTLYDIYYDIYKERHVCCPIIDYNHYGGLFGSVRHDNQYPERQSGIDTRRSAKHRQARRQHF